MSASAPEEDRAAGRDAVGPDERLAELTQELRAASARLSDGDLTPDAAAALVEQTARLAGEAAAELDRRARAAGAR